MILKHIPSIVMSASLLVGGFAAAEAPYSSRNETRSEADGSKPVLIHEIRGISLQGKNTEAVASGSSFKTLDIEINAVSGRILITDLTIVDVQGNVIDLDSLLEDSANAAVFKRGQVDRTGAKNIPGRIRLALPGLTSVKQVNTSLQGIAVSGRDAEETRSVVVTLIGRAGVAVNPQPVPAPQPPPYQPPYNPPTPPPAPLCDLGNLNRELGRCEVERDMAASEISRLASQLGFSQGQISALAPMENQYRQCEDRRASLQTEVGARKDRQRASRNELQNLINSNEELRREALKPFATVWRCYVVSRHVRGDLKANIMAGRLTDEQVTQANPADRNSWQLTKEGTPGKILAEVSVNCAHNGCGKRDWDQAWGCNPIR